MEALVTALYTQLVNCIIIDINLGLAPSFAQRGPTRVRMQSAQFLAHFDQLVVIARVEPLLTCARTE